jgi:hypothetical protein
MGGLAGCVHASQSDGNVCVGCMAGAPSASNVTCPSLLLWLQLAALRQSLAAIQVDKERKVGRLGGEAGGGDGKEISRHVESRAKGKGCGVEGASSKANLVKSPEEDNKDIADFEDELR